MAFISTRLMSTVSRVSDPVNIFKNQWALIASRPRSTERIVFVVISALFFITVGQLIIQWYYTYLSFAKKPKNRFDILILAVNSSSIPILESISTVFQGIAEILADGLMVSMNGILIFLVTN